MPLVVKIGADPEVFLRHKESGKIVSAHDLMPGTKEEPYAVKSGAIQVDGLAAEFNIDPANTGAEFVNNIAMVMSELQSKVGSGYEFVIEPSTMFDENYFKSLPEFNRTLGCIPDWNGWTGQLNEKPDGGIYQRAAGGHIHIGWGDKMNPDDPMHIEDCAKVARQMDYFLGMYSIYWDKDQDRRKMYGKAGCFRPKPYGMEYRTLSNKWLTTPRLQRWVYDAATQGFHNLVSGDGAIEDKLGNVCVDIINNSVEWWKDKKINLVSLTGMVPPPVPPKPRDPSFKYSDAALTKGMKEKYGMSDHLAQVYIEAATNGNAEAISKCNEVLGVEYFQYQ